MPDDSAKHPIGAALAGKYEVRRLLGSGGMGAVYEGVHVEIGKRVAIKILDRDHSRNEEIAERFRREGRAASRVESEHVVQVFDVGNDDVHGLYMVMEFLVGEDLATRLERERMLDVPIAIDVAWQAARGLAKAHAAGVVHRDLKPANVFLAQRDDGSTIVKLVDFGISKLLTEESKGAITRHGSALGTPQYMSPEQAQGHAIDHRTDIWSLGAVLFEMLAGKPAYDLLENYEQTIFAIVLNDPPSLAAVAPWVPERLAALVGKALTHDPDLRIQDCGTFARLLADAAHELDPGPRSRPNAPLVLTRRSSGSLPRVVPPDEPAPPVVVVPEGATADAKAAPTDPNATTVRPPAQPVTVTGMAVRTGNYPSVEPDEAAIPSTPPRRRGALLALLAIAAVIGGAAFLFAGRLDPASSRPVEAPEPPPVAATTTDPITPHAGAAAAPKPSGTPPAAKPAKPPPAKAAPKSASSSIPSTKPSASAAKPANDAAAKPAATAGGGSGDQFGGVGVSSSY